MPQSDAEYIIKTKNLSKAYSQGEVLSNLELNVAKNSIFAFLGPNGAGKSTTLKILLGFIRPTRGQALVFGLDSIRESVKIRQRLGYLAQEPHYYDSMTARQVLIFTLKFFYKGTSKEFKNHIDKTLELVGLEGKSDRKIKGFSGGEKQRLGIAQAYISNPELLILDEPAAALDPIGRRDILNVMQRLRKYTTIFYSTHILSDAQKISDTVAILNKGKLIAQGPIAQLIGSQKSSYQIIVKGDVQEVLKMLKNETWIASCQTESIDLSTSKLDIIVSDIAAAEEKLLNILMKQPALKVVDFGQKKQDLEETFFRLINQPTL